MVPIFCPHRQNDQAMKKILLLALCIGLGAPLPVDGQVKVKHKKHYVKIKPKEPKFKKVPMPGRNYVYVREDWRWNEATNTWDWYGNRWVETPAPRQVWIPGRWVKSGDGWVWAEGYWK